MIYLVDMMDDNTRLAIYSRTSKTRDEESMKTIDQQIDAGIKWAKEQGYSYTLYTDEGITGYKINDNEDDPFLNRPEMLRMINDIKVGKIDSVWVWEHSRLARNQYASAYLDTRIFLRYKVTVYVNGSKYDCNNPHEKLTRDILNAFSEYERNLIVSRTTRGLYTAIDKGNRSFCKFFGYKKLNKNASGRYIFEPIEHELSMIKRAYELYNSGKSLNEITRILYKDKNLDEKDIHKLSTKWFRILNHKEYTGYTLTVEGLEIEASSDNTNIEKIQELKNDKYWVKSNPYPIELISRDTWLQTKLKLLRNKGSRGKFRLTNALSTGLIKCSVCEDGYYYHEVTNKKNKIKYPYYTHKNGALRKFCTQRPKTVGVKKIDDIFSFIYWFYFYNAADIQDLMTEVNSEKVQQLKNYRLEIKNLESKNNKLQKKIREIQNQILDDADLKTSLRVIESFEIEEKNNKELIRNLTFRIDSIKITKTNLRVLEDKIQEFKNTEPKQKRELLLSIVDFAYIYGNILIVKAKQNVFYYIDLKDTPFLNHKTNVTFLRQKIEELKKHKEFNIARGTQISLRSMGIQCFRVKATQENEDPYRKKLLAILDSNNVIYQFPEESFILYSFTRRITSQWYNDNYSQ